MKSNTIGQQVVTDYRKLREAVSAHALETDTSKGRGPIAEASPDHVTISVLHGDSGATSKITYREKTVGCTPVLEEEDRTPDAVVVLRRVDAQTGTLMGEWINGREQPLAPLSDAPPRLDGRQVLKHYDAIRQKLAEPPRNYPNAFLLDGEEEDQHRFMAGSGGVGWPGMTNVEVLEATPEHLRTRESDGLGASASKEYAYEVESNGGPYKTLVCTQKRSPAPWLYGAGDKGETVVHRIDMATGETAQ